MSASQSKINVDTIKYLAAQYEQLSKRLDMLEKLCLVLVEQRGNENSSDRDDNSSERERTMRREDDNSVNATTLRDAALPSRFMRTAY